MESLISSILTIYLNIINVFFSNLGGKHAFHVFCYPFSAKLSEKQQAFLDTAHQFKLGVRDFEIQCYRWGYGSKKLLFVHGWQSNSYRWRKYVESFSHQEYTMYAFDAPGHGNSGSIIGNIPLYGEALHSIVNHCGRIDSIIAHSIGSLSTLCYLSFYPESLPHKIISLASPGSAEDFTKDYFKQLRLTKSTIRNFTRYFESYANQKISFYTLENLINDKYPLGLIIHDRNDQIVRYDYARTMHSLWPNSKLITTEGFGHKLRDDQIVNLVHDFIESRHSVLENSETSGDLPSELVSEQIVQS